jgi:hypothetical protein
MVQRLRLYMMIMAFVPELRPKDRRIRTTSDIDTRWRIEFLGFTKYIGKDKRKFRTIGYMSPAGYFFQGLGNAAIGSFLVLFDKLDELHLLLPAGLIAAALFVGGLCAIYSPRFPSSPAKSTS